jgi:hypothetical protein
MLEEYGGIVNVAVPKRLVSPVELFKRYVLFSTPRRE